MKRAMLLLPVFLLCLSTQSGAEQMNLTAASLPEFLANYEKRLAPLDAVYEDLENENLPLMDESGQPQGHRPLENRRRALAELRQTLQQLGAEPKNLVLVSGLFVQSESLTDDLYDLSQIAYDNDREELGKRLADLVTRLDAERDLIESYTLSLAAEKEAHIRELERENQNLRQELERVVKDRDTNPAPH